jgi:hypothetical protein
MSIVRLTLIMLGTATYLGLAILGLGATASFFRPPAAHGPRPSGRKAAPHGVPGRVRGVLRADVAVTPRALLATPGIARNAAVLAETVGADGSKMIRPGQILTRFGQSDRLAND